MCLQILLIIKMKKIIFLLAIIATFASCKKTKEDIANSLIEKGLKTMQNAGEEVEIIRMDSLTPARLTFDETQEGVKMKQSIDSLEREVSERLQFLKPWAGVANINSELQEVNDKIALIRQIEDSLKIARAHFTFDKNMLMKSIVIKRKEQGNLITDTAYFFFDKQVTKCTGIKGKDKGSYIYVQMPF